MFDDLGFALKVYATILVLIGLLTGCIVSFLFHHLFFF